MAVARAVARYVRTQPRKVRLSLDLIRGKTVDAARRVLQRLPNKGARIVLKVIESAAANAKDRLGGDPEACRIVKATADEGPAWKRAQSMSMARVGQIRRRTSHIEIVLEETASAAPRPRPAARRGKEARA